MNNMPRPDLLGDVLSVNLKERDQSLIEGYWSDWKSKSLLSKEGYKQWKIGFTLDFAFTLSTWVYHDPGQGAWLPVPVYHPFGWSAPQKTLISMSIQVVSYLYVLGCHDLSPTEIDGNFIWFGLFTVFDKVNLKSVNTFNTKSYFY